MRILYVEDNEVNQALVERVARAKKCEVIFLEEGEEALKLLASDPNINLVLLDIELAGSFSGLDVIKSLRARQDKRPVVAVTAYAMMGDRERILNAGCDQYLPKPLVIGDLLALIEHYEHKAEAQPAPAETGANGSAPVVSSTPAVASAAGTASAVDVSSAADTASAAGSASAGDTGKADAAESGGTDDPQDEPDSVEQDAARSPAAESRVPDTPPAEPDSTGPSAAVSAGESQSEQAPAAKDAPA